MEVDLGVVEDLTAEAVDIEVVGDLIVVAVDLKIEALAGLLPFRRRVITDFCL